MIQANNAKRRTFSVKRKSTSTTRPMARTIRRLRRSRARVRRNPPKMTPSLKRKIGARIRALHRAGKYRRSRPARVSRRRRRSASLASSRPVFRSSRRRRSGIRRSFRRRSGSRRRSGGGLGIMGGGLFGIGTYLKSDTIKLVGGALAGTFVANYGCAFICPRLPSGIGGNPFVQAAVKLGVTAITAKFVARYSRPVATGMVLGAGLVVVNDLIRQFTGGAAASSTSQYLGRGMSQYLGAGAGRPAVNRNIQSMVGPVTPSAKTFGRMGALYGNTNAFKSDAWTR